MKVSEAKPTNQPAAIAAARRNGRPLRIGGGPPNYADNAAKATERALALHAPADFVKGRDAQIEKAVEGLKEQLASRKTTTQPQQ